MIGEGDLRSELVDYLTAKGWHEPSEQGPMGGIWSHPKATFAVPVPHEFHAGDPVWRDILGRLADAEKRSQDIIESEIKLWSVDVTNLRAANDLVIADTIPLEAGAQLLSSAWTMFRASATTSLGSRPHIRGNYRKLGDESVSSLRMAHTRQGSYVVPILMPLSLTSAEGDQLLGIDIVAPEPPERRVTRTFAEALSALEQVIVRPPYEPRPDSLADLATAGVSHEFAAALHRVLRESAVSSFEATFEWAKSATAPASLPASVEIPSSAAARVETAATYLKQPRPRREIEILTGPIIEVRHTPDDPLGSVVIQTTHNARMAHVRVNISAGRVPSALEWMRSHETMVVRGRIVRTAAGLRCDEKDAILPLSETLLPG